MKEREEKRIKHRDLQKMDERANTYVWRHSLSHPHESGHARLCTLFHLLTNNH